MAKELCASCHVVAVDQKQMPTVKPPVISFKEIAQRPTTDASSLQGFLSSTHSNISHPGAMPNPEITADQIRDVVAYILSLRGK